MNRRAKIKEIEKEYWMNRKQKIEALMSFYGLTKKEAEEWLNEGFREQESKDQ